VSSFQIFDSTNGTIRYIEIFWKKYSLVLHLVEMVTDPDPALDQQALDADSDPDPPT
jgi:hypothetical protein